MPTGDFREDELTPDGVNLWNNLTNSEFISKLGQNPEENEPKTKKDKKYVELTIELKAVKRQCEDTMAEMKLKIEHWTKKEQYFKALEAKVTYTMAEFYSKVMKNLLEEGKAFPVEMNIIDDEETSNTFIE